MANESDVKVKLSAEGVAEVVAAFRKIATEGKKAGHEAADGMHALREGVKEVSKELLAFASVGFAIEKTKELFKEVLEGAESLEKLHQKTGISTAAIQGYSQAAREAGVNVDVLNTSFTKFGKAVDGALNGDAKSADAFSKLGISIKDLKDQSPDQVLALVSKKIAELPAGFEKAAISQQLFGKGGAELIPVLNEVSEQGLDHFIEKTKQLGTFLDDLTIHQMKAAGDAFKDIGEEVKGLATQFLVGLVPAAKQAADEMVRSTMSGTNGFKMLGEGVGTAIKIVELAFLGVGKFIGTVIAEIASEWEGFVDQIKNGANTIASTASNLVHGQFRAAGSSITGGARNALQISQNNRERTVAIWQSLKDDLGETYKRLFPGGDPAAPENFKKEGGGGEGGITLQDEKLGKARLALIEAQLQAQLAIYKAQAALLEQNDKEAFEKGLLSLQKYFADRRDIVTTEAAQELKILQTRRAAIAALPVSENDPIAGIAKQAQLAKIDGDIAAQKINTQARLSALATEESKQAQQIADQKIKAEQTLYQLQGKRFEAAKLALQQELTKLDEMLQKSGVSGADRQAAVDIARTQGEAKIQFDQLKQQADVQLTQLNTQIKQIQDQVANGLIYQAQGEQQILALERQRLPVLQQIGQEMTGVAQQTGLDTAITQAGQFNEKVAEIKTTTNETGLQLAKFKETTQDAFQSGIAQFLDDTIMKSKSAGDAFKSMASSILSDIAKMAEQALAAAIIKKLFGAAGGGGGGAVSGFAALFDGGGYTGSGRKNEPAGIVHRGEYVLPQEVVQKPGMLQMLQALHTGMLTPRSAPSPSMAGYASGGVVSGGGSTNLSVHPRIINVLDPTTLGDHLTTPEGEQAVINVISRNPSRVNQALR